MSQEASFPSRVALAAFGATLAYKYVRRHWAGVVSVVDAADVPPLTAADLALCQRWRQHLGGAAASLDADALTAHILSVWHDIKAEQHVYNCIQKMAFLQPRIATLFGFDEVVARCAGTSTRVLDVGCAFGQDLRHLLASAPALDPRNVVVTDLVDAFWRAGRKIYGDDAAPGGPLDRVTAVFGMSFFWFLFSLDGVCFFSGMA